MINYSRCLSRACALSIALTSLGAIYSSVSFAQLEEIVVTARARTESLQDVPATITAFTQSQIDNMGVQRAEDFVAMTPGVTLVNTVEAGDTQLSIRGMHVLEFQSFKHTGHSIFQNMFNKYIINHVILIIN